MAAASSAVANRAASAPSCDLKVNCRPVPTLPPPPPPPVSRRSGRCRSEQRECGWRLRCSSTFVLDMDCRSFLKEETLWCEFGPRSRHGRRRRMLPYPGLDSTTRPSVASFTKADDGGSGEGGATDEEKSAIMEFAGLSRDKSAEREDDPQAISEEKQKLEATARPTDALTSTERQPEVYRSGRHGSGIANAVTMYMSLLERSASSDGRMIANAGSVLLERVEEEVRGLREVKGVNVQYLFEVLRVAKLLQMDLQLIGASRKSNTLSGRVNETKAHCRQMLDIVAAL